MLNNYKLTIAVITMNRKEQLTEALKSCMESDLPENTEVVVIDNASTDGTGDAVKDFFANYNGILWNYIYLDENLGVGGGRAKAFESAQGEYVYFLDDDAIIAKDSQRVFFTAAIKYMDKNRQVASLTTRIYDEMLVRDRDVEFSAKTKIDGLPIVFKFLGGSHFLRKEYFSTPLYFDIKYGCEEYAPSIQAQEKGYYHVFDDNIYIVHKPKVNKWIDGSADMEYVESCGCAARFATKSMLYPSICYPILWLGYKRRCEKYLKQYQGAYKKTDKMVREIKRNNNCKKIRLSTVFRLYKEFGLTVL